MIACLFHQDIINKVDHTIGSHNRRGGGDDPSDNSSLGLDLNILIVPTDAQRLELCGCGAERLYQECVHSSTIPRELHQDRDNMAAEYRQQSPLRSNFIETGVTIRFGCAATHHLLIVCGFFYKQKRSEHLVFLNASFLVVQHGNEIAGRDVIECLVCWYKDGVLSREDVVS